MRGAAGVRRPGRRGWSRRAAFLLGALVLGAGGCSRPLPEAESEGAKLYAKHCNNCHRVFPPQSLKFDMWKYQVERMQAVIARQGLTPMTPAERDTVLEYLKRHSG